MSSPPAGSETPPAYSFGLLSTDVLPVVTFLAAVASGLSGQQPTGNVLADFVLSAGFGAGVVWLSRWAGPQALLISAVLALAFSGSQPFALVALVATASAIFVTAWRQLDAESRVIGAAVTTALTTQAVLNLPNIKWVGSASLLAVFAIAPLMWTAWPHVPKPHQKIAFWAGAGAIGFAAIAASLAVVAGLSVRDSVERGIDQAQEGVAALEAGDQDLAVALLTAAESNFQNAESRLEGPMTWPARFVPVVAQHSRALETAAHEGASLARTAVRTVTSADIDRIRGQNGAVDLEVVSQVNAELSNANAVLASAQLSLRDVRTPWLLPTVDSRLEAVQIELAATHDDIDLANHATAVLPGILGSESSRRYLVLFVQPAESREFGGFVGAYGILEADAGQLSLTEAGSIHTDLGQGTAVYTNPGDFPRSYIEQLADEFPQNLTGIADLPTIAQAARDLVPQWREDDSFTIDGVVTMDPYALAGLLEFTGPVSLDSVADDITADTVVDFLLRDQYLEFDDAAGAERHEALEDLAGAAFDELLQIELPGPEQLGAVFGPIARANRIGFVSFDEAENQFLRRVFLSGGMPVVGEFVEMVGVYGSTAVASKLDAYSTRSMTYTVTVDPGSGLVTGEMEISISNDLPDGATGYVVGLAEGPGAAPSIDGGLLPLGDNLLALSIYSRSAVSDLVSPDTAFETTEPTAALGYDRTVIGIEVPRGSTKHVTFRTESQVAPGRYDLLLAAQPTANIGDFSLIIQPVPGWRVAGDATASDGSWTSTTPLDVSRGFTFFFRAGQLR